MLRLIEPLQGVKGFELDGCASGVPPSSGNSSEDCVDGVVVSPRRSFCRTTAGGQLPSKLAAYALLVQVDALEASAQSLLARVIEIRRALEGRPDRGRLGLHLEAITSAAQHTAKATTQLKQFPLGRP